MVVSQRSRMYWLHVSRRILPNTSGRDKSPQTIGITRKIIDGAIEKFGLDEFCDGIGITGSIDISEVFEGLLLGEDFEYERTLLKELPSQVVLTKFNQINLLEYYELEKLAYEVWKCGATLRSIGKGGTIYVDHSDDDYFIEIRSDDLAFLIDNYDQRNFSKITSRKGVVLEDQEDVTVGKLLVPVYNVGLQKVDIFNNFFAKLGININFGENYISNFIPWLYPIRGFYKNNKPLGDNFYKQYKIEVVSILTVLTSIIYRLFHKLIIEKEVSIIKPLFMRGYQGPFLETEILEEIEYYKELAYLNLNLDEEEIIKVNIQDGYSFLKLQNTKIIDLLFTAPVKLFIPVSSDRIIIDFSKVNSILDDLMFGIKISDENFKGDLFELITGNRKSALPTSQCYAENGTSKQIDFAFGLGETLLICEYKLKENSIGYYKGQYEAIKTRERDVVIKSITEIDEKANWLCENPTGKNYDISAFKNILPVGISAFKEFIHTRTKTYWITDNIPRVITIEELESLIQDHKPENNYYNIKLIKSR